MGVPVIQIHPYTWWSVCLFALLSSFSATIFLALWIGRGKAIAQQRASIDRLLNDVDRLSKDLWQEQRRRHHRRIGGGS